MAQFERTLLVIVRVRLCFIGRSVASLIKSARHERVVVIVSVRPASFADESLTVSSEVLTDAIKTLGDVDVLHLVWDFDRRRVDFLAVGLWAVIFRRSDCW